MAKKIITNEIPGDPNNLREIYHDDIEAKKIPQKRYSNKKRYKRDDTRRDKQKNGKCRSLKMGKKVKYDTLLEFSEDIQKEYFQRIFYEYPTIGWKAISEMLSIPLSTLNKKLIELGFSPNSSSSNMRSYYRSLEYKLVRNKFFDQYVGKVSKNQSILTIHFNNSEAANTFLQLMKDSKFVDFIDIKEVD